MKIPISICESPYKTPLLQESACLRKEGASTESAVNSKSSNTCSSNLKQESTTEKVEQTQKSTKFESVPNAKPPEPIYKENVLPLTVKGSFLQDSFFDNQRQDFLSSMNNVLENNKEASGATAATNDQFSNYRNLRQHSAKEDNHVSTVTEDHQSYKVFRKQMVSGNLTDFK